MLFGIALLAFSVWLAVRLVNRRERWVKRTAISLLVGCVLIYPLSLGPVTFTWSFRGEPRS
jgi:hypothetical protein